MTIFIFFLLCGIPFVIDIEKVMMKRVIAVAAACVLLAGCDVFEYHPYDVRLAGKYKGINRRNIERIVAADEGKDTVRFVFMGDTQRWYDETEDFVKALNMRDVIDFVVHGGDMSDFGMKKEFCMMHDIMNRLKVPYVAIVGNHDHLGSGEDIYRTMYGDLNFAFVYGGVKFLGLNTNALEYDYSTPVPDFVFLEREREDTCSVYDRTVAMMHADPGDVVFNNNVKRVFHEYLKGFPQLMFCVHAHDHMLSRRELFDDGIVYYGSDAIKHRNYLLFTVTKTEYEYEVVYF